MRAVEQRGKVLVVRWMDPVQQRLQVALDHAQWRPQLVRHVCQEPAPLDGVLLEPLCHLVEGASQATDLARSALGHARAVVPRLDLSRRFDQVPDRRRRAPDAGSEQQRHEDGQGREQRAIRGR